MEGLSVLEGRGERVSPIIATDMMDSWKQIGGESMLRVGKQEETS